MPGAGSTAPPAHMRHTRACCHRRTGCQPPNHILFLHQGQSTHAGRESGSRGYTTAWSFHGVLPRSYGPHRNYVLHTMHLQTTSVAPAVELYDKHPWPLGCFWPHLYARPRIKNGYKRWRSQDACERAPISPVLRLFTAPANRHHTHHIIAPLPVNVRLSMLYTCRESTAVRNSTYGTAVPDANPQLSRHRQSGAPACGGRPFSWRRPMCAQPYVSSQQEHRSFCFLPSHWFERTAHLSSFDCTAACRHPRRGQIISSHRRKGVRTPDALFQHNPFSHLSVSTIQ